MGDDPMTDEDVVRWGNVVISLRERARRAEAERDAARASRDEAVELLREWATWYAASRG